MKSGFKVGNVDLKSPLILAPMSGVTNSPFRRLIQSYNPGVLGLVVTEFISIEGLTRFNPRSVQMMEFREEERPISIQIFGGEVNRMVDAALMAEDRGADIVDINCGCPVPKVVRKGGGCELMRQPGHLYKILTSVEKKLSVPLTLKIRAGWDSTSRNGLQVAKVAEEAGIKMLAVHGRTRVEGYRGKADWNLIGEISENLKIPVVGSGDVVDYQSAVERFSSGVSGLMVGRAALLNPWIFTEIAQGKDFIRPSNIETVDVLERYLGLLREELPEKAVIGKMKQLCSQVTRRVRGSKLERKAFLQCKTTEEMEEKFANWRDYLANQNDLDALDELHAHPEYESALMRA